jgi:hypothetical protein
VLEAHHQHHDHGHDLDRRQRPGADRLHQCDPLLSQQQRPTPGRLPARPVGRPGELQPHRLLLGRRQLRRRSECRRHPQDAARSGHGQPVPPRAPLLRLQRVGVTPISPHTRETTHMKKNFSSTMRRDLAIATSGWLLAA